MVLKLGLVAEPGDGIYRPTCSKECAEKLEEQLMPLNIGVACTVFNNSILTLEY